MQINRYTLYVCVNTCIDTSTYIHLYVCVNTYIDRPTDYIIAHPEAENAALRVSVLRGALELCTTTDIHYMYV